MNTFIVRIRQGNKNKLYAHQHHSGHWTTIRASDGTSAWPVCNEYLISVHYVANLPTDVWRFVTTQFNFIFKCALHWDNYYETFLSIFLNFQHNKSILFSDSIRPDAFHPYRTLLNWVSFEDCIEGKVWPIHFVTGTYLPLDARMCYLTFIYNFVFLLKFLSANIDDRLCYSEISFFKSKIKIK